jgi:hypothetical protein
VDKCQGSALQKPGAGKEGSARVLCGARREGVGARGVRWRFTRRRQPPVTHGCGVSETAALRRSHTVLLGRVRWSLGILSAPDI